MLRNELLEDIFEGNGTGKIPLEPSDSLENSSGPEINKFHSEIAAVLSIHNAHSFEAIYMPEDFNGDWAKLPPHKYWAHVVSVEGIDMNSTNISPLEVSNVLAGRRETLTKHQEHLELVQTAYDDFNQRMKRLGLPQQKFDVNQLFFLKRARISELLVQQGYEDLDHTGQALTLVKGAREILIPEDDAQLMGDSDYLYDVVVHELGHLERPSTIGMSSGKILLEEGIVQLNARALEIQNDRVSRRTTEIYSIETDVADELTQGLGIESLMPYSQDVIEQLVNDTFSSPEHPYPYAEILSDLNTYSTLRQTLLGEFETMSPEEKSAAKPLMKQRLVQQRDAIFKRWFSDRIDL